jgi:NTE family protein
MMKWMDKTIGLALGGGGARGLAHVGVLRVLEEEAIHIDVLVGTSAGALVGGAYAGGIAIDEFIEKTDYYLNSDEFQSSAIKAIEDAHSQDEVGLTQKIQTFLMNRFYIAQAMFRPGVLSSEDFQSMIDYFIPDIQIEETRIPFRAVATDLVSGEQIVFSSGSLRQAVMASCAVPGAIEPLNSGDMCLSDGGIICLVPSSVARREGVDIVIAVAVDPDICTADEFHTAREVHDRAVEIMSHQLEHYELREADIIIRPNVGDLHWSDFSRARDLIDEGEKAARDKLEDIRDAMPVKKSWFTLKQILRGNRKSIHQ